MHLNLKISFLLLLILSLPLTSCLHDEEIVTPEEENIDNGNGIRSRAVLEYPDIYEITNTETVWNEAMAAWKKMLADATMFYRREIGFYIYYRHSSKTYFFGDWVYGPMLPYSEGAYVNLGTPLFPTQLCAFFHCHTPCYGPKGRATGPTQDDVNVAYNLGVPGFVFDFNSPSVWGDFPYEDENNPKATPFGPRQRAPYQTN